MVQISIDTTTTDFKVGGIITTSCAESMDGDWVSRNEDLHVTRHSCLKLIINNHLKEGLANSEPRICILLRRSTIGSKTKSKFRIGFYIYEYAIYQENIDYSFSVFSYLVQQTQPQFRPHHRH